MKFYAAYHWDDKGFPVWLAENSYSPGYHWTFTADLAKLFHSRDEARDAAYNTPFHSLPLVQTSKQKANLFLNWFDRICERYECIPLL